jgi:hypothetical protein
MERSVLIFVTVIDNIDDNRNDDYNYVGFEVLSAVVMNFRLLRYDVV